ncbi:hypothetical protein HanPI659440_Chr17g0667321 [Helianthus annuus]|nr:hypothetical protein HanPI659440_Chr17g0667321 [Helianthus annuus]
MMAAIYMGGRIPQIVLNIKRGSVEIEKLNLVIKELVKVDKDAMLDRMSQIEAMLTATVRK